MADGSHCDKSKNRHICATATVWPIATKFGKTAPVKISNSYKIMMAGGGRQLFLILKNHE